MQNKNLIRRLNKQQIIVVTIIISILILTAGYISYKLEESSIRQQTYTKLKVITDHKQSQIENWIRERIAHANVVVNSNFFADAVADFLQNPDDIELKQYLLDRLLVVQEEFDYENIFLRAPDNKMIGTVLRNLLSNAVKFTRVDGKVSIKSEDHNNSTVKITVEDDGVGIPEKDVKRLFKIEEKVSSLGTNGEKSIGLGLLLCKEFIEMHGGIIRVESKENEGSKFSFTLKGENGHEI